MIFTTTDDQFEAFVFRDHHTASRAGLQHAQAFRHPMTFRVDPEPRGRTGYVVKIWPQNKPHICAERGWMCETVQRAKRIKEKGEEP